MRPKPGSYPHYYENYIPLVKQDTILQAFKENEKEVINFFNSIPAAKENHAYADGKWTIKQLLCHLNDTERIFAYRCLRFARRDPQQLASYEEDHYAANCGVESRTLKDLVEEFESVRKSSIHLFKHFNEEDLLQTGLTPSGSSTVLAIGYTICGHTLHHINVVKERYL